MSIMNSRRPMGAPTRTTAYHIINGSDLHSRQFLVLDDRAGLGAKLCGEARYHARFGSLADSVTLFCLVRSTSKS
jgi:hypothetical protein